MSKFSLVKAGSIVPCEEFQMEIDCYRSYWCLRVVVNSLNFTFSCTLFLATVKFKFSCII